MTPEETKAWDLLEKMNNGKISKDLWKNCSDYARKDLKRKALIVVDEIQNIKSVYHDVDLYDYWESVKSEIEKL